MKNVIVAFFIFCSLAVAQDNATKDREAETNATIPALTEFHTVIYQIWHKGWPEKDTALLVRLIPDIEKGVKNISEAKLPGILHEKNEAWKKQVSYLNDITAEYKNAAKKGDGDLLLESAEKLHACYEGLVRVIRPAMKEMMEFHKVLYGLYHYDLPAKEMAKIGPSVKELKKAMTLLDNAALPTRLAKNADAFKSQRAKLSASVDALYTIAETGDLDKTSDAVETMHSEYQALEQLAE